MRGIIILIVFSILLFGMCLCVEHSVRRQVVYEGITHNCIHKLKIDRTTIYLWRGESYLHGDSIWTFTNEGEVEQRNLKDLK